MKEAFAMKRGELFKVLALAVGFYLYRVRCARLGPTVDDHRDYER
jgi:hypothetical protein